MIPGGRCTLESTKRSTYFLKRLCYSVTNWSITQVGKLKIQEKNIQGSNLIYKVSYVVSLQL